MKKAIFLLVLILIRYGTSFGQTTLFAPDTTAFNDTTVFYVSYHGTTPNPLFKWVVTDEFGGYDSLQMEYLYNPRYRIGSDSTFSYVFPRGGNYEIILETPETTIRRRINVWEPKQRPCNLFVSECGNSILNSSFEASSEFPNCNGQAGRSCGWQVAMVKRYHPLYGTVSVVQHDGSPDYWHRDFDINAPGFECSRFEIPTATTPGYYAEQDTRIPGQNAYMGFFTHYMHGKAGIIQNQFHGNYREYLQQYLVKPLIPGRTYTLTFYYSMGEMSTHGTDFHVGFTTNVPEYHPYYAAIAPSNNISEWQLTSPTPAQGQLLTIKPTPFNYACDYDAWYPVTITFTYSGLSPANYITVGNWKDDADSFIFPLIFSPDRNMAWADTYDHYEACYYLVDEIQVVENNNACCGADVYIDGRQTPKNISDYTIIPGQKIFIEGTLNINTSCTFNNNQVFLGGNARINVGNGKILQIMNNSYLRACSVMWEGIFASGTSSRIYVTDSKIEDAIQGIFVSNGARINCSNGTFNKNLHSIRYNNYNAFYPTIVEKTYFNCSQGLLPPYWGQRSYSHILADSAGTVQIAPTDVTKYNRYYNANFGIIANKTALVVSNSRFVNIKDYNAGNSFAIACNSYKPYPPYLGVGDLGTGNGNQFLNCDNGIFVNGNITYQIYKNTFQNIKYKAVYGVNNKILPGGSSPTIEVDHNTFTNVMRGVDLVDFYESPVLVDNNTITNPTANPNTYGIRLTNSLPIPVRTCTNTYPAYPHKVVNNRIDQFGAGITANSVKCLLIDNNNVYPRAQGPGQYVGIHTTSSNSVIVSNNHVIGDVSDWRVTGIRSDNSMGGKFRCNTTEKCGPAFMFGGSVNGYVKMYNNDMYNAQSGVYLNYAEIGGQLSSMSSQHNRWHGSFTNHLYTYNSFGTNSPFYFINGEQGTPLWPTPLLSNTVGFPYNPISNDLAPSFDGDLYSNCNLDWYGGERSLDSISLLESVQRIITQGTVPPAYVDEVNYLRKLAAYSSIMDNPWLLTATPEIASFMTETGEYTKVYKALKYIETGSYANAINHLNTIDVSDSVNEVLVTSALVYISLQKTAFGKQNINELPKIADLLVLREYAEKCIYQYNDGTLASRLLLEKMFGWEIDSDCEEPKSKPTSAVPPVPELRLYPNPASHTINIELLNANESGLYSFVLYDITGKQVYSSYLYAGLQTINLPDLPDGLYIYRTNSENAILNTGKLVIKK